MDQMGSQNGMDELEIIDAESEKMTAMLRALPRVEAPSNFEFRVKAGIAKGSPARSAFFPILKTAAPLALILLVVGFGFLYYQAPSGTDVNSIRNTEAMAVPGLPPVRSSEPVPVEQPSVVTPLPRDVASTRAEQRSVEPNRVTRPTASSSSTNRAHDGSFESTLNQANVFMPRGTQSANPRNINANTSGTSSTNLPVREVLGMFGVEGDFADGGWKVRAVKDNSIGSRAKIVAGDVIESIDGQAVKNETKLKVGAKTFTVRRDGKVITLSSGN